MKGKKPYILSLIFFALFISCKKKQTTPEPTPAPVANPVASFNNISSSTNPVFKSNNIHAILFHQADQSIWIGTDSGLVIYKNNSWSCLSTSNSGLGNNIVNCLAFNQTNGVWIGTNGGLFNYNGTSWQQFTTSNSSLPVNKIRSLANDSVNNRLWIGTFSGGGLASYDFSTFTLYTPSNSGLPNNSVANVMLDSVNNIWSATGGGVSRFDGSVWTNYTSANSGLANSQVYCIAGNYGKLYFGSNGGVSILSGNSWSTFSTANSSLPNNLIRGFGIYNKPSLARIYVATEGSGLSVIENNNIVENINTTNSNLASGYLTCLCVNPITHELWIGTQSNGISVLSLN